MGLIRSSKQHPSAAPSQEHWSEDAVYRAILAGGEQAVVDLIAQWESGRLTNGGHAFANAIEDALRGIMDGRRPDEWDDVHSELLLDLVEPILIDITQSVPRLREMITTWLDRTFQEEKPMPKSARHGFELALLDARRSLGAWDEPESWGRFFGRLGDPSLLVIINGIAKDCFTKAMVWSLALDWNNVNVRRCVSTAISERLYDLELQGCSRADARRITAGEIIAALDEAQPDDDTRRIVEEIAEQCDVRLRQPPPPIPPDVRAVMRALDRVSREGITEVLAARDILDEELLGTSNRGFAEAVFSAEAITALHAAKITGEERVRAWVLLLGALPSPASVERLCSVVSNGAAYGIERGLRNLSPALLEAIAACDGHLNETNLRSDHKANAAISDFMSRCFGMTVYTGEDARFLRRAFEVVCSLSISAPDAIRGGIRAACLSDSLALLILPDEKVEIEASERAVATLFSSGLDLFTEETFGLWASEIRDAFEAHCEDGNSTSGRMHEWLYFLATTLSKQASYCGYLHEVGINLNYVISRTQDSALGDYPVPSLILAETYQ